MCEVDELGYHVVGYFSKEKMSEEGFNLACICSLPCHQVPVFLRACHEMHGPPLYSSWVSIA
jgi:hypothetical protein